METDIKKLTYLEKITDAERADQREEERKLYDIIHGDNETESYNARLALFEKHQKFASWMTKQFRLKNASFFEEFDMDYYDYLNAAYQAMWYATMKYEPDQGEYIQCATNWITNYLTRRKYEQNVVHVPKNPIVDDIRSAIFAYYNDNQTVVPPTVEYIMEATGYNRKTVQMHIDNLFTHISFDAPIENRKTKEKGETTFLDMFENTVLAIEDDSDDRKLDKIEIMMNVISNLADYEKLILSCYYGLFGIERMTLCDIAKELGYTQERIRQFIVEILLKVKTGMLKKIA